MTGVVPDQSLTLSIDSDIDSNFAIRLFAG